ncbi:MAG: hypothetical protein N2578_08110, partial [Bdellovibrionaceae bacterium]|nr:hypothetical protein [Pseudobdellovibrionaceae bacterium]
MTIFGPDEFKEFVESKEAPVSSRWRDLQDLAFAQNPSSVSVLLNLLLVHILSSLITLTICPQLGVGFGGQGLRHWYMMLGHTVCEILCGITYFSVTSIVGWLFLPLSHRRWVARRPVLVSATLVSMT